MVSALLKAISNGVQASAMTVETGLNALLHLRTHLMQLVQLSRVSHKAYLLRQLPHPREGIGLALLANERFRQLFISLKDRLIIKSVSELEYAQQTLLTSLHEKNPSYRRTN